MNAPVRAGAVLAALVLGSTALLGPAPATGAVAATGELAVGISFGTSGAEGCALETDTSSTGQLPFATDGVAVTSSRSATATVENADDPADDTTMTATVAGRVRATESAGTLHTLTMSVTLSASVTAAQGAASECQSTALAQSGAQTQFTLPRPGWLTLRGTSEGGALQATVVNVGEVTDEGTVLLVKGLKGEHTRQFLAPAGAYVVVALYSLEVLSPNVPGGASAGAGGGGVELGFTPVGGATGPATGTGRKYLGFDRAVSCGAGSVSATFSGKAAAVRTATLFLNGKRTKVVRRPGAGSVVALRGIPLSSAVTVKAVLALKAGGRKTVSRSYAACT